MNQRIWSSLTAALLLSSLGVATSSQANQVAAANQGQENGLTSQANSAPEPVAPSQPLASAAPPSEDVVKVGEQQSPTEVDVEENVAARIQAHELDGRQAAILYVHDIPVLTFLGDEAVAPDGTKVGESGDSNNRSNAETKEASNQDSSSSGTFTESANRELSNPISGNSSSDPVWRATAVAARLNQMRQNNVSAEAINVAWNEDCNCYVIRINDEDLVRIDSNTRLPDTTNNLEVDALQATNRLRRQMGNASPLEEVSGRPKQQAPQANLLGRLNGLASWYGPGFHGRRSANGEVYNQNALTAAHRSLPFGTRVRVTNLNNGRSVVVRITDRGPFARRRVIDLSAAAARVLGLIQAGVAPVNLDVIDNSRTVAEEN